MAERGYLGIVDDKNTPLTKVETDTLITFMRDRIASAAGYRGADEESKIVAEEVKELEAAVRASIGPRDVTVLEIETYYNLAIEKMDREYSDRGADKSFVSTRVNAGEIIKFDMDQVQALSRTKIFEQAVGIYTSAGYTPEEAQRNAEKDLGEREGFGQTLYSTFALPLNVGEQAIGRVGDAFEFAGSVLGASAEIITTDEVPDLNKWRAESAAAGLKNTLQGEARQKEIVAPLKEALASDIAAIADAASKVGPRSKNPIKTLSGYDTLRRGYEFLSNLGGVEREEQFIDQDRALVAYKHKVSEATDAFRKLSPAQQQNLANTKLGRQVREADEEAEKRWRTETFTSREGNNLTRENLFGSFSDPKNKGGAEAKELLLAEVEGKLAERDFSQISSNAGERGVSSLQMKYALLAVVRPVGTNNNVTILSSPDVDINAAEAAGRREAATKMRAEKLVASAAKEIPVDDLFVGEDEARKISEKRGIKNIELSPVGGIVRIGEVKKAAGVDEVKFIDLFIARDEVAYQRRRDNLAQGGNRAAPTTSSVTLASSTPPVSLQENESERAEAERRRLAALNQRPANSTPVAAAPVSPAASGQTGGATKGLFEAFIGVVFALFGQGDIQVAMADLMNAFSGEKAPRTAPPGNPLDFNRDGKVAKEEIMDEKNRDKLAAALKEKPELKGELAKLGMTEADINGLIGGQSIASNDRGDSGPQRTS